MNVSFQSDVIDDGKRDKPSGKYATRVRKLMLDKQNQPQTATKGLQ